MRTVSCVSRASLQAAPIMVKQLDDACQTSTLHVPLGDAWRESGN
jgi:hypothetical protein